VRTFGLTEADIVGDLFIGVNEILNLESRYKQNEKDNKGV